MKQNDLLTNEPFFARRITQKFARAQNRIKYHNKKATKLRHSISYISKPLHQNLKILNRLLKDSEQCKYHREYMSGAGYDFSKITNYISFEGKELPCLYNYVIQNVGEHMILIKKLKTEK